LPASAGLPTGFWQKPVMDGHSTDTITSRSIDFINRNSNNLKQNTLLENTIVIVFSDNGGLENSASQIPLRHGKGWIYEGGIRVSMMISCPGKILRNRISDQPIATIDILPKIMDLAGVKVKIPAMDGISLVPVLKENKPLKREALYWNYETGIAFARYFN